MSFASSSNCHAAHTIKRNRLPVDTASHAGIGRRQKHGLLSDHLQQRPGKILLLSSGDNLVISLSLWQDYPTELRKINDIHRYSKPCYTNCNDVIHVIQWVEWFQCGWCECVVPKTPISSECRSTCLCSHPTCRNWKQWDSQVAPGWNSLTYGCEAKTMFLKERTGWSASFVTKFHWLWQDDPKAIKGNRFPSKAFITVNVAHQFVLGPTAWVSKALDSQHVSGTTSSIAKYGPFVICT